MDNKELILTERRFASHLAIVATLIFAAGVITASAHPPQSNAVPNSPQSQTAGQKFKNVQVLKDIPADELIPSMQFITSSLGVECDFCHVPKEFDKDDKKEKKTAREMMRMMFAINKNNFEGERAVTCNTCHRGSPHPQAIPAILAEAPKPAPAEPSEAHPPAPTSGAPLLAKFIENVGGESALAKIASRVETGKLVTAEGPAAAITIYTKAPDERVSIMQTPKGDSVTGYNGRAGWILFPGRPARFMTPGDQEATRLDAEAFYPQALRTQFSELKLQPQPEMVGSNQADVVVATGKGQPPVKFYFDKSSGLLVRMVHYVDTALGLNPIQIDYADYREIGGVKTPYRWTLSRPSGSFTIQIDKVEQNVPIDSARFAAPPVETGTTSPSAGH